jgi:predicted short-subunit dehydrogenase-like oxidoreductase (DUF2520 family)
MRREPPIAILGTGRVARAMGRVLVNRGAPVAIVAGRRMDQAAEAAGFVGPAVEAARIEELPARVDRILVAVPDGAVTEVAQRLAAAGMRAGVVLHTSGVSGPEALAPLGAAGVSCGALHPLQTVSTAVRGVEVLPGATYGLTASGAAAEWAEEIVALLDGTVLSIPAEARAAYHAAAVLAGNGTVALLDAAETLMERAGVSRERGRAALAPLVAASLSNVLSAGSTGSLTGPIERGDVETVAAHLRALTSESILLADLYRSVAAQLLDVAKRREVPPERVAEMERLIGRGEARHA